MQLFKTVNFFSLMSLIFVSVAFANPDPARSTGTDKVDMDGIILIVPNDKQGFKIETEEMEFDGQSTITFSVLNNLGQITGINVKLTVVKLSLNSIDAKTNVTVTNKKGEEFQVQSIDGRKLFEEVTNNRKFWTSAIRKGCPATFNFEVLGSMIIMKSVERACSAEILESPAAK